MITKELLHERFDYKDGKLIYKIKTGPKKRIGDVAGNVSSQGYIVVGINNKQYGKHRLVWIYFNGEIPDGMQIDHINNIKTDNRVENLRLATPLQNKYNTPRKKDNTSGYKGVSHYNRDKTWRAAIRINGRARNLGYFATPEQASEAYKQAADKLHGEFAKY